MSFALNSIHNAYSYCVGAFISQDEKDDRLLAAAKKKDLNSVQTLIIQGANPNIQDVVGNTPLLLAIDVGSSEIARFLINNGAHPDVYGKICSSPLYIAIYRRNQEIALLLIERGANLNTKEREGKTPLHWAVELQQVEVVRTLVSLGVDVNTPDARGNFPLYSVVCSRWQYAFNEEILNLLAGRGAEYVDRGGRSPLHLAAFLGKKEMVDALISRGADIEARDKSGKTPLHAALGQHYYSDLGSVDKLIEKGADINSQDNQGNTPLHTAIAKRNFCAFKYIIEKGVDVNIQNNDGETPLSLLFTSYGFQTEIPEIEECVDLLIKGGAAFDIRIKDGETVLSKIIAFISSNPQKTWGLKLLERILKEPLNLEVQNNNMETPLHLATKRGAVEVMKLLIEGGAHIDAQNKRLQTPLFVAVSMPSVDMVKLLIEKKANLDLQDETGRTALMECFNQYSWASEDNKKRSIGRGKLLIECGANLDVKDKKAETALHKAINEGCTELAQVLIEGGANINTQDKEGKAPLHLALGKSYLETVKLLISNKANINIQDKDGLTPLHLAVISQDLEVIKLLISNKANVNIRSEDGWSGNVTPLYYALDRGDEEIYEFLMESGAELSMPMLVLVLRSAHLQDKDLKMARALVEKGVCRSAGGSPKESEALKLLFTKVLELEKSEEITRVFDMIYLKTVTEGKPSYSSVRRCVKEEEKKVLTKLLRGYGGLSDLLKEKQKIEVSLAKAKKDKDSAKITALEERLEEFERPTFDEQGRCVRYKLSELRRKVEKTKKLIKEGKVQEAKRELGAPDLNRKLKYEALICACLIGIAAKDSSLEDVNSIISAFVNKMDLKDPQKHQNLLLVIMDLLGNQDITKEEAIAVFRQVMNGGKKDILKSLTILHSLMALNAFASIKKIINSKEDSLTSLRRAFDELFKSSFNLEGVDQVEEKYSKTFGDIKRFRNGEAIFIYLGSLRKGSDQEAENLFSLYIRDVLEGRFLDERYNLERSPHLKTIFESKPDLLAKWRKGEGLFVEALLQNQETEPLALDYQKIFHEKIITDNHLGKDWEKIYPHLVAGLNGEEQAREGLRNIDNELSALRTKISETAVEGECEELEKLVNILEAQRQLLILCENKRLAKEVQIELLKTASVLFSQTGLENDLMALLKGFSSSGGGLRYTVCDTDDPCDILLMGTEILGSCQAIRNNYPGLNRGLLGALLDGKYRVIAVKNERGQLVSRCLLKILWDEKAQTPVLFQERVYAFNEPNNSEYHTKLLNEMCRRKAQEMSVPLVAIGRGGDGGEQYLNQVESLGGRSHVEYVDALRGINSNTYSISNCAVIWQP